MEITERDEFTLTQLILEFNRLRRHVNQLEGRIDGLTGRRRSRSYGELSTQTDPCPSTAANEGSSQSIVSRSNFPTGSNTIYSIFPRHGDADHLNFTASMPTGSPLDSSNQSRDPKESPMLQVESDTDSEHSISSESDDCADFSIPGWLFDQDDADASPIVPNWLFSQAESEADRSDQQERAESSTRSKSVHFSDDSIRPRARKLCIDLHSSARGLPEQVLFDLPRDPSQTQFYLNPRSAIPHHEVYPNIKVAVTASGRRRTGTAKFLFSKWSTGQQLHDKIRSHFGIPEEEDVQIAFAQYEMILPNDRELWSYGMRYFPAFIARIPENFQRGDLMEIQFLGKGPNINGDPTQVRRRSSM
jgi:hypothetical protein